MPWMIPVVEAAGAVIGAAATINQGQIAKQTGEYNQQVASQQAAGVADETREQAMRSEINNRRLLAEQTAGFAAGGARIDSGTPLQVAAQTAGILKLNTLDQQRQGYTQSQSLLSQGAAGKIYGETAASGAVVGAAGSLLGGLGKAGQDYYTGKKLGLY